MLTNSWYISLVFILFNNCCLNLILMVGSSGDLSVSVKGK